MDETSEYLAVAGRTGFAHYSVSTRKWRLFGNETQEKDFIVTGGILWWQENIIMGCYNLVRDHEYNTANLTVFSLRAYCGYCLFNTILLVGRFARRDSNLSSKGETRQRVCPHTEGGRSSFTRQSSG
jgi:hypothetical protein